MASRSVSMLTPRCSYLFFKFEEEMNKAGIKFMLTCTARTVKEQVALYAQGRQPLEEVNSLRKIAGMDSITFAENRRKVTWTLQSKHLIDLDDSNPYNDRARAFDIAILNENRKPTWDLKVDVNRDMRPDYEQAVEIGRKVGLVCGADFKNQDYPHFEEPST